MPQSAAIMHSGSCFLRHLAFLQTIIFSQDEASAKNTGEPSETERKIALEVENNQELPEQQN